MLTEMDSNVRQMLDVVDKLGISFIINLFTDPREEKPTPDSWVVIPTLRMGVLSNCWRDVQLRKSRNRLHQWH
jgi:hypothetical protein